MSPAPAKACRAGPAVVVVAQVDVTRSLTFQSVRVSLGGRLPAEADCRCGCRVISSSGSLRDILPIGRALGQERGLSTPRQHREIN